MSIYFVLLIRSCLVNQYRAKWLLIIPECLITLVDPKVFRLYFSVSLAVYIDLQDKLLKFVINGTKS